MFLSFRATVAALSLLLLLTRASSGAMLQFHYEGVVVFSALQPYGITIPNSSPVSGAFSYDPLSSPVNTTSTTADYDQAVIGGFTATIGGVTIRADDYLVSVGNDYPQLNGSTADFLTILYSSESSPAPSLPLIVNGTSHTVSLLSLNLIAPNTLFSSTSLPVSLNRSQFSTALEFFGDSPLNPNQINIAITAITAVPEPSASIIFLGGVPAVLGAMIAHGRKNRRTAFRNASRTPPGFTLVELLACIAIIGALTALLLPAIQAARESSRRASCANNLKQIGLALANYEATARVLPVGANSQGYFGLSWWVGILPYCEQAPLYARLDQAGGNPGSVLLNLTNQKAVDGVIVSTWFCPSSTLSPFVQASDYQVMAPSYVGIAGASSHGGFIEARVAQCCVSDHNSGEISGGGLLISNQAVGISQTTDGLSNTLIVGECSLDGIAADGVSHRIDGSVPFGWIAGTAASGTPPLYDVLEPNRPRPSYNITTVRYPPNTRDYDEPGIKYDHGPNNPLASSHPQGIHAAIADGSVRFLSDNLDLSVFKSLATRDNGA